LLAPLVGIRVLDLTEAEAALAGKMLADLGAEVIKIEPPGGEIGRRRGPYRGDDETPAQSLFFAFYNQGKRGVTLNLDRAEGRMLFSRLAARADVVLENFGPSRRDALGFTPQAVTDAYPRLVWTSLTPFGDVGPYRDWSGPDLVLAALGGAAYLAGDPDREPVRIGWPQYWQHAAAEGAVATLMALWDRRRTGRGRQITVAAQLSVIRTLMNATGFWPLQGEIPRRQGRWARHGTLSLPQVMPCRDGYVFVGILGGVIGASVNALVAWMREEGAKTEAIGSVDWREIDFHRLSEQVGDAEAFLSAVAQEVEAFTRARTKAELFAGAARRRILLAPINNAADVLAHPQLAARDFWREADEPPGGRPLRWPGPWVRFSATPLVDPPRPAPRLGEHNEAVYGGELGLDAGQLAALAGAGVI
jgi:crotonobetainyl-CoA:carnitine CoA-transferase CaiB-like acyl-CoA transferase